MKADAELLRSMLRGTGLRSAFFLFFGFSCAMLLATGACLWDIDDDHHHRRYDRYYDGCWDRDPYYYDRYYRDRERERHEERREHEDHGKHGWPDGYREHHD